ncbi:MAG: glutamyl-tRNA reductase [Telluria sp.]|nr:glutamyl-tRNA reductase [Telluria sp.]
MNLLAVGLNHTTAPLALREQVAFAPEQLAQAVGAARAWLERHLGAGAEAAILSTCNRTELYAAAPAAADIDSALEAIGRFMADYHKLSYEQLRPHLYARRCQHAARHAFRVASGLDSMVLGEPQILGQMKDAARRAEAGAGLGTYLHQLFQRAFSVAKQVRSDTAIGAHSISMAAAAVRLSQRIFPSLAEQKVLFIGAGAMIELCAAHFAAHNPRSITVANRTLARAQFLAQRYHGNALRLSDLPQHLAEFDIVVSCTGSALPIIDAGLLKEALKARRRKPMFLADLAVPRDIDSAAAELPDLFLYSVDDLSAVVQSGREQRQGAVQQAEAIIDGGVHAYMQWADKRIVVPAICDLHAISEAMRAGELARARKMLARGDDIGGVLEALSKGLTAKFLHGPRQALQQARGAERDQLATLLPRLFHSGA